MDLDTILSWKDDMINILKGVIIQEFDSQVHMWGEGDTSPVF